MSSWCVYGKEAQLAFPGKDLTDLLGAAGITPPIPPRGKAIGIALHSSCGQLLAAVQQMDRGALFGGNE